MADVGDLVEVHRQNDAHFNQDQEHYLEPRNISRLRLNCTSETKSLFSEHVQLRG